MLQLRKARTCDLVVENASLANRRHTAMPKLSKFWLKQVEVCFAQIKTRFNLRKAISDLKYSYVTATRDKGHGRVLNPPADHSQIRHFEKETCRKCLGLVTWKRQS